MPALTPSPPQSTMPAFLRRRVWAHPDLRSHSLVILTPERLYLAPLTGTPKPEAVAAAEAGADLETLLGPLATEIPLAGIRRMKLDLDANSLVLDSVRGGRGTSRLSLLFATSEAADACFTKVWRRLGSTCELLPYRREWWVLARAPLAVLAVVFVATAMLALAVSIVEDFSPGGLPRSPLQVLLGWMDWRVVCGLGGSAAAATQMWLYRRLTHPPTALEVART